MSDKEKLDFYERWLKTLDNMYPDVRGKVNGASISLTGLYVAVKVDGLVEIVMTDNERWRK